MMQHEVEENSRNDKELNKGNKEEEERVKPE